MKYLVKLNTLKISRNRIEKPDDIINLRQLSALKNLTINENPISKTSGYVELCAYINDQIEVDYLIEVKYSFFNNNQIIDSKRISSELKKSATKLFTFDKEEVNNQIVENKV